MEEIALTVVRGMVRLIIPVALIATLVAIFLVVKSVSDLRRKNTPAAPEASSHGDSGANSSRSQLVERVSVGLCAMLAVAGASALVTNEIRRNPRPHPLSFVFFAILILLGAPALAWRSSWRVPAEGLATVALSVIAVLSGFSIGFAFLPLLVAMVWVCFHHLRPAPPRVDSSL